MSLKLTRSQYTSIFFQDINSLSADYLGKQFGPRSGSTNLRPDQGTDCLTLGYIVLCLKELFQKNILRKNQHTPL